MSKDSRTTPLPLMTELHLWLEASISANGGELLPLNEAVSPTPEQVEEVRQRWQKELDGDDEL